VDWGHCNAQDKANADRWGCNLWGYSLYLTGGGVYPQVGLHQGITYGRQQGSKFFVVLGSSQDLIAPWLGAAAGSGASRNITPVGVAGLLDATEAHACGLPPHLAPSYSQ
jgi:hypothetical protein